MKIKNYIGDIKAITPNDVFLLSYPKSGNTRFRMALGKYIDLLKPSTEGDFTYDFVNKYLPEFGRGNVKSAKEHLENLAIPKTFPIFIKSHLSYSKLRFIYKSNPIIFINRKSADVVMSYYDYSLARGIISDMTFSEFLRSKKFGLPNLLSYTSEMEGKATVIINYEELIQDDVKIILAALNKINAKYDEDLMKEAIIQTRREKVQKLENKLDNQDYNFASQKIRKLDKYFNDTDKKYYNEKIANTSFKPIADS